jgi:hypothetical protein
VTAEEDGESAQVETPETAHPDAAVVDTRQARAQQRDELLLDALAEGCTHREAGQVAGCSAKTVQRMMLNDDFRAELARRRSVVLNEITGRLARITERAITTIEETLEAESPSLRFRAATSIVSMALRFREEEETERRLNRLERQAAQLAPEALEPWDSRTEQR